MENQTPIWETKPGNTFPTLRQASTPSTEDILKIKLHEKWQKIADDAVAQARAVEGLPKDLVDGLEFIEREICYHRKQAQYALKV